MRNRDTEKAAGIQRPKPATPHKPDVELFAPNYWQRCHCDNCSRARLRAVHGHAERQDDSFSEVAHS